MELLKSIVRKLIPSSILRPILSWYHFNLALLSALRYGQPANQLFVIGVTGTKGKSTTVEIINTILEEAGYTTALAGTIRFKIGKVSKPNLFKMTMPGRGFLQKFLREAVTAGCTHVVMEVTSEGARQHRHIGIPLNALVFTNIAPEHIESHGSYDGYKEAKLAIGDSLVASHKRPRIMVANSEDELGEKFLSLTVERKIGFSKKDAEPYTLSTHGIEMNFGTIHFTTPLQGIFNLENIVAAGTLARELGIAPSVIAKALEHIAPIKGRVEYVDEGQPFPAIVDYAHTPDSLKALYEAFPNHAKICVLGNTGGGRDVWKRPEMAKIAETYCEQIILTNEDPYDEDPRSILDAMAAGMTHKKPLLIMDRREAIKTALSEANTRGGNVAVLITGKGTDPYIMGAQGTKISWSDSQVTREELKRVLETK